MSIILDFDKGIVKVDLTEKIVQATLEALLQQAYHMKDVAYDLCPKDTGALANSIRVENTAKRVSLRAGGYVTNPKTHKIVDYAGYVEQTQPFLWPSWFIVRTLALEDIKRHIEERCST